LRNVDEEYRGTKKETPTHVIVIGHLYSSNEQSDFVAVFPKKMRA
jgi:hypothetical protein